MAVGASDKHNRPKPSGPGKPSTIGFGFAQAGWNKSNLHAAVANQPAPTRSRSMAPLRTSLGRKEQPPVPSTDPDDVFGSPIKIGDPAPQPAESRARNQPTNGGFQYRSTPNEDDDVRMSSWPPVPINRSQGPATLLSHNQSMAPDDPPTLDGHLHHTNPHLPPHSSIDDAPKMWHETPAPHTRTTSNGNDENHTSSRLPPSSIPHSNRNLPSNANTDAYPAPHTEGGKQVRSGTRNVSGDEQALNMPGSYSTVLPARAGPTQASWMAHGTDQRGWGYEDQAAFEQKDPIPSRPSTAFARRHELDEDDQAETNAAPLRQDPSHFPASAHSDTPHHSRLPPSKVETNNGHLPKETSLRHVPFSQPQSGGPTFGNPSSASFPLSRSGHSSLTNRPGTDVSPSGHIEQNEPQQALPTSYGQWYNPSYSFEGHGTLQPPTNDPLNLSGNPTTPFRNSRTDPNRSFEPSLSVQQGQQCPPPFFGKRNTPAPIESPAPIDVGGLGSVVRQIEDAQRKYKLAEEANFNHLKTIRELQVEKSRLNELNHTLSEEVQSAKTEIETIKQAKEDSIANAKKLVQECFDKVAVVTTAFAEYEEAAASRMEASEQAIGELRRTTAEVNNIKEGVEAHFQKSESARQVMAATAAQAVSEVKEATEGHAKAIEKLKDATEEHTRAIDAKDAIIRELMGTIATKEDHNKQLDQYIQAMVATVGDDVKSFTDQLRALVESGLLSPESVAALQADRADDRSSLKTLRGIKVADQKLIDDLRSRLHETELSKSDLENELTSEHQQEIHDMKSRHSSSLMASAQEINTLQVANASLKQEVKDLQEKLQTKEAEAKANDIKLREAATVAHAGGESIQAQLESEIETMRTEKKQVEVRIESYQREIQTLNDTITQTNQEEKVAQALANERMLSIKELKADIAQKTQQLQQVPKLEKENAILQTQLSKAKDQSNAAEAELQRAKVEISQFKDSAPTTSGVKDLQSKVADLRQRIEDKDAHMKHLNSLVEAAQTLSNSYQSDLAKKTEDNEMFSALQLAEIDDLKRQLQGASKETGPSTTALQRLQLGQMTEEDRAFQSAVEQPLRTEARNKDNVIRENDLKKFAPNARSTNTSRGDVPTTKKAPAPAPAPKIRAGSVSSLSDVGAVEESTINNSAGQNSNGKRPISAVEDEENESDDDADWLLAAENAARSAADPQTKKPAVKQTKANARSDAVPERRASGGPMF